MCRWRCGMWFGERQGEWVYLPPWIDCWVTVKESRYWYRTMMEEAVINHDHCQKTLETKSGSWSTISSYHAVNCASSSWSMRSSLLSLMKVSLLLISLLLNCAVQSMLKDFRSNLSYPSSTPFSSLVVWWKSRYRIRYDCIMSRAWSSVSLLNIVMPWMLVISRKIGLIDALHSLSTYLGRSISSFQNLNANQIRPGISSQRGVGE